MIMHNLPDTSQLSVAIPVYNFGSFLAQTLGSILDRRGENDSFSNDGMLARLDIQINGLLDIIKDIFGEASLEAIELKRVLRSEVVPHWSRSVHHDLECNGGSAKEFSQLEKMLTRIEPMQKIIEKVT